MPADPELLADRRRLGRQISVWRFLAIVAAVAAVAAGVGRLGFIGDKHIARLSIGGVITDDPDRSRAIAAAAKNPDVEALIVRIDSPGGTVVGGESLFKDLRAFAAVKPVVAVMGEVAASGGYMVALAAEQIFAREGTITGSIGVILQTTDVTGLLSKLGISTEALKSGPLKAVPSPLEPLTDAGREATMQLVRDMYDMFVDMVAERRNLPRERAVELADGRVYTGRQAKALGLIDAIGGESEARAWLAAKGISADLPVRELKIERADDSWPELIGAGLSLLTGKTYLSERLKLDGLVALWHPELGAR
ncbi:MAG TPA: signal peptide peptidase SppA [Alphaproteobacteria bacterium]